MKFNKTINEAGGIQQQQVDPNVKRINQQIEQLQKQILRKQEELLRINKQNNTKAAQSINKQQNGTQNGGPPGSPLG